MKLRENILIKISDPRIRAKIVLASPKKIADSTVVRRIKDNHHTLTDDWCLKVIAEELGIENINQFFETNIQ